MIEKICTQCHKVKKPHAKVIRQDHCQCHLANLQKWQTDYENGMTYKAIADKYELNEATVFKHLRRIGVGRDRSESAHTGEDHHMWKGQAADQNSIHRWVKKRLPKPEVCLDCKTSPPVDLANISNTYNPETYTRDLENWEWLCRSCHMKKDGRLEHLMGLKRIYITRKGKRMTIAEWSRETGINYRTLVSRYKAGWDTERIFK